MCVVPDPSTILLDLPDPVLTCPVLPAQMYCLLIRVDFSGPEPNLWSYFVTHAVFFIGFFTLAVLLGEW